MKRLNPLEHKITPRGRVFYNWPGGHCNDPLVFKDPAQLGVEPYDIIIVGAGVVGSALAYELSQYDLRVLLLDKKYDVGEGTSKGNSALIHVGFDEEPGSLEAELVTQASRVWPELAGKLKVPLRETGALLAALDNEQAAQLEKLYRKSLTNGVDDVEIVSADHLHRLEPNLSPHVLCGLLVPRESVVDPFTVSIAYCEVAVANGVDVVFGVGVLSVEDTMKTIMKLVDESGHRFPTRVVANVAGLGSRKLADSYRGEHFDINPRRGQFLIYDRNTSHLIERILLPVPSMKTKGKLIAPTIFGNLLTGPTAEDLPLDDPGVTATTLDGLTEVRQAALQMCPRLSEHLPIASYAGARCNCAQGSFRVAVGDGHPGIVTVTGIRSTGLTASPMLAKYLVERIGDAGLISLAHDKQAVDSRPESAWPGWWKHPWDDPFRITAKPSYGRMVCFCELISEGEILDALDSPLHPCSLDAVKRRTRAQTGRCQGFNCQVRIGELIAGRYGLELAHVTKCGPGTELLPEWSKETT